MLLVARAGDEQLVGDLGVELGLAGADHLVDAGRVLVAGGVGALELAREGDLVGVRVRDGDVVQRAAGRDQVDRAPVRDPRHRELGHLRQRLLVVQRGGQRLAHAREEGQLLGPELGHAARDPGAALELGEHHRQRAAADDRQQRGHVVALEEDAVDLAGDDGEDQRVDGHPGGDARAQHHGRDERRGGEQPDRDRLARQGGVDGEEHQADDHRQQQPPALESTPLCATCHRHPPSRIAAPGAETRIVTILRALSGRARTTPARAA